MHPAMARPHVLDICDAKNLMHVFSIIRHLFAFEKPLSLGKGINLFAYRVVYHIDKPLCTF
jgi:hypothetical protein